MTKNNKMLVNEKKKKLPLNVLTKKGLAAFALTGLMIASPFMLAGCSGSEGKQGPAGQDGLDGKNGSTWYSGTQYSDNEGVVGDFFYDIDDFKIYQKTEDGWKLLSDIKGQDGLTPYIKNDNWWIGEEDTGIKALGTNGTTPSISINSDGYWVINNQVTEYKAQGSLNELYTQLSGIMQLSGEYSFDMTYHPYALDDEETMSSEDNKWAFVTSTFSGWGGSLGKPTNFNTISFKIKARDAGINQITLYLNKNDKNGETLATETIDVNVQPFEEKTIYWTLTDTIENADSSNLWFAYACDNYCDYNGTGLTTKSSPATIPDSEPKILGGYFTDGNNQLSQFTNIYVEPDSTPVYNYIHAKVGVSTPKFVLKKDVLDELLKNSNIYNYNDTELCLADTINGFVGQKIQIYFANIMPYSLDDVYVRVSSNGKGNIYSDRWEYTPSAEETFNLKISIYSKNFDLLYESNHNVNIKSTPTKTSVNVLVIGDSTVASGHETSQMVSLDESDSDFSLTLLGTQGSEQNKYEGRGGWTANMYVNTQQTTSTYSYTNPFYNPSTSKFDFSYYMTEQNYDSVDVVYFQLGINDIFSANTQSSLETAIESYLSNMEYMIQNIKSYNNNIKIVINPIIPCQPDQNKFTTVYGTSQTSWGFKYNMYKANMALIEKFENDSNVYISWYNASLDAVTNQNNDVHPSINGYKQLGEQMYYYLKSII